MTTTLLQKPEIATVGEARKTFADLCNRVAYAAKNVIITKHGKPTAAVISMADYEELQRLRVLQSLKSIDNNDTISLEELNSKLGI